MHSVSKKNNLQHTAFNIEGKSVESVFFILSDVGEGWWVIHNQKPARLEAIKLH